MSSTPKASDRRRPEICGGFGPVPETGITRNFRHGDQPPTPSEQADIAASPTLSSRQSAAKRDPQLLWGIKFGDTSA